MTTHIGGSNRKRFGHSSELPERTLIQRMDALDKADRIRTYRADLKRDLKAGRANIIHILGANEIDPMLETMKLFDLILAVPTYGRVKVNKILQVCRISPTKTLGGLSKRQRAELISKLCL